MKLVVQVVLILLASAAGVSGSEYQFRCFVVVGTTEDCEATLVVLHKEFAKP